MNLISRSLFPLLCLTCLSTSAAEQLKSAESFEVGGPNHSAGGLAIAGNSLWVSSQSIREPDTVTQYSMKGRKLKELPFDHGGNLGGGVAVDDKKRVFVLDYLNIIKYADRPPRVTGNGIIYELKGRKLEPKLVLPRDFNNTFGITAHKGDLYFGRSPTVAPKGTIYKVGGGGDGFFGVHEGEFYIQSLASDGAVLWVGTEKGVLKLNDEYGVGQSYRLPFDPAGIAIEGKNLWAIENNANKLHRLELP